MTDSARVGCSFETRGGLDRRTRRLRMLSSARCHVPSGFCQPLRRQTDGLHVNVRSQPGAIEPGWPRVGDVLNSGQLYSECDGHAGSLSAENTR